MTARDPDHVSRYPDWVRPPSWPYEEDWSSPAWERRMAAVYAKAAEETEQFGFVVCPSCKTAHTVQDGTYR